MTSAVCSAGVVDNGAVVGDGGGTIFVGFPSASGILHALKINNTAANIRFMVSPIR